MAYAGGAIQKSDMPMTGLFITEFDGPPPVKGVQDRSDREQVFPITRSEVVVLEVVEHDYRGYYTSQIINYN